jgi:hypothetical protein
MKYNTFRNIFWVAGAAIGALVLVYSCGGSSDSKKTDAKPNAFANTNNSNVPSVQDIMKVFESSTGGKPKLKDAFSSSPAKVNLYDDMSKGRWGRAKIDYDRDEKDDEKWERDPVTGEITREISSNDDGNFDIKETWNGSSFAASGASLTPIEAPPIVTPPVVTPTVMNAPDAASAGNSGALAVKDIMKVFEGPTGGQVKLKDAFSGSPTKVNMYDDAKTGKWTRAKIDYDRDEKDDEKWERDPVTGQITRILSPNEDDKFGPKQTWTGSAFVQ